MLLPDPEIILRIYAVGGPAIVMQALTSVMTYGMNLILGSVSVNAVTAYGIYYKLQNFIFMPAFGLNNASVPIISYNYGASHRQRIRDAIRRGLLVVLCIMTAGILLLQFFAGPIISCFSLPEEASNLCIIALMRMVVVVLPLAWILSRSSHAATLVWWAFPAAEGTACLAAVGLAMHIYRKSKES